VPDRPSKLARVDFAHPLKTFSATPRLGYGFLPLLGNHGGGRGAVNAEPERFVWGTATEAMSRKLVWIERERFWGFGCSKCGWRFKPSSAPTGTSFDEMMSNFELQRDKEFTSHVCADHPRAKSTRSENE
jgi:hypothetical protein